VDVVVVADTHLRSGIDRLPPPLRRAIDRADAVVHAGDVVSAEALAALQSLCELYAVLGNNDSGLIGLLPERLAFELGGVRLGVIHDSGPTTGRARRMARLFADRELVIFGHSHAPVNEVGLDGQLLFNPGSPTQRRGQPVHTYGRLRLEGGRIARHAIVPID
jgi:putative phosphoesterase